MMLRMSTLFCDMSDLSNDMNDRTVQCRPCGTGCRERCRSDHIMQFRPGQDQVQGAIWQASSRDWVGLKWGSGRLQVPTESARSTSWQACGSAALSLQEPGDVLLGSPRRLDPQHHRRVAALALCDEDPGLRMAKKASSVKIMNPLLKEPILTMLCL